MDGYKGLEFVFTFFLSLGPSPRLEGICSTFERIPLLSMLTGKEYLTLPYGWLWGEEGGG